MFPHCPGHFEAPEETTYPPLMAIREEDIIHIDAPPMNRLEAVYVPEIVRGLGTTMRHFFTSFGQGRTSRTIHYPEQRREHKDPIDGGQNKSNFRGVHRLNRDDAGRVKPKLLAEMGRGVVTELMRMPAMLALPPFEFFGLLVREAFVTGLDGFELAGAELLPCQGRPRWEGVVAGAVDRS